MSATNLEQGTQAWRQARTGIITGSRIGAVLGISPFQSRKALLREMVDEANGIYSDFDNEPMRWGRENEETAVKLYSFLYGEDEVSETGFHTKEMIGASPDRLVGEFGLVEIKCPWNQREEKVPQFKSIEDKDMRHYYHQIQAQLYVTDRQWCDFFQWAPNGYRCERVMRKENWYPLHRDLFREFMDDYEALLAVASTGGAEEKVGRSARWAAAVEDYRMAELTERAAAADKAKAKEILVSLMKEAKIDHCEGAGLRAQQVVRPGSVDWKKLATDQLTKEVVETIEEEYRKDGTSYWMVKDMGESDGES